MKTSVIFSGLLLFLAATAGWARAQECEEAGKMLDWAKQKSPSAMTEQMFQSALQSCPDNVDYYRQIAEYYMTWFKDEFNADKQIEYKEKAIAYLEKALAVSQGKTRQELQGELAALQQQNSFSKLAMRRLRPSTQGASGTGLSLKVLFNVDSYDLSDRAQEHLDILGAYLLEHHSTEISLEGHTDRRGERDYNQVLSQRRAESAKAYLVEKYGVQPERILTAGHGFDQLAESAMPFDPANRRVEVIKIKE